MATTYFSDTFPGTTLNTAKWNPYFFNNYDEWPATNNQLLMSNVIVSNSLYLEVNKGAPDGQPYSGAMINVSLKAVDAAKDKVQFYGPVFPHVAYRLARPFTGSYEAAFGHAIEDLPEKAGFSCNCVLNYLYSELEGKRTGHVIGPMTFGEVAYVLLNQTVVHLTLETY